MGIKQFFNNWFGKPSKKEIVESENNNSNSELKNEEEIIVYSPVNGKAIPLSKVSDPVFAEEMTGKGLAVSPNDGEKAVKSPVSGTVKVAFPTGHAYGILTEEGPEFLIHIGIDTVELEGKGFIKKVEEESKVDKNSDLTDIDLKTLKSEGKETDIIVIVTSDSIADYKIEYLVDFDTEVKVGQELYKLTKESK